MPLGLASDPAPQQLTAPCRKYSGRLHHSIEQVVYRLHIRHFLRIRRAGLSASPGRWYGTVRPITKLIFAFVLTASAATAQQPAAPAIKGVVVDARTGSPLPKILVAVQAGP